MTTTDHNAADVRRVLFLSSDTGGGHRAAATAIQQTLANRYPGQYDCRSVDVFRCCTPFPYRYMPEIYPRWVTYSSITWQFAYLLSDGRLRSRFLLDAAFFTWRTKLRQMLIHEAPDVIVCVHSLFNRAALHVLQGMAQRPPFITVVTDLVSTPVSWYQRNADAILVATDEAYQRGLDVGMRPEQLQVTGLPVHPDFATRLIDKQAARVQLGWHPEKTAVLLVSGGDGMGPVFETVRAINDQCFDMQLAIVAGRNVNLIRRLDTLDWNQPTKVYPFIDYIATLMAAADILITKAGPATITEACMAGLPMILSGRVPGQEDGNVRLVVNRKAGVYAPRPHLVVDYLRRWLHTDTGIRDAFSTAAQHLARPDAAMQITDIIHQHAQHPQPYRHRHQPTQPSWSRLFPRWRPLSTNPPQP
jgi:1,2-diacylglycerol 3-beta-galactosyltransferase